MKRFELYVSAFLSQHVHHELEVIRVTNIACHNGKIVAV